MTTPILGLPELILNQSQPHLLINAAFRELEQGAALFNVLSASTTAPPGSPADGDAYIVPPAASGAWSASVHDIAFYSAGWKFIAPRTGWLAYVVDAEDYYQYEGDSPSGWAAYIAPTSPTGKAAPKFSVSVTASPGTTQNDYAPAGWAAATTTRLLLLAASGDTTITGLDHTGVGDGTEVLIRNTSTTDNLIFAHLSGASAAGNKFFCPGGVGPFVIVPGDFARAIYIVNQWVIK
jgi:Protein of unknown function (DUF2793)